jgi:hypothetical protein
MAHLEPIIYFCYQTEFPESSEFLRDELQLIVEKLNQKSRLPIALKESHRLTDGPVRLDSTLMRSLRQSLLFIADATAIAPNPVISNQVLLSPTVCVEIGYALQSKRSEQVLVAQMERTDLPGQFPLDLPSQQRLPFKDKSQLHKTLPDLVQTQLQRFNLFS